MKKAILTILARFSQIVLSCFALALLVARMHQYHMRMKSIGASMNWIIANEIVQVSIWWGLVLFTVWKVLPGVYGRK